MNDAIQNFLDREEKRLARLKIFCDEIGLNFYSAKEEIAQACNEMSNRGLYISTDEFQKRFIAAKTHNIEINLTQEHFWELFDHMAKEKNQHD